MCPTGALAPAALALAPTGISPHALPSARAWPGLFRPSPDCTPAPAAALPPARRAANPQGVLKGYDQKTNVILDESHERVFATDAPVEQVPLGLYLVRGDNMCAPARLARAQPVRLPVHAPSPDTSRRLLRALGARRLRPPAAPPCACAGRAAR